MTNYADRSTVEAKAGEWTEAQIQCRLGNHSWWRKGRTTVSHYTRSGGMVIEQRCAAGCGVRRRAEMNQQAVILTAWSLDYSNAKGYLMQDDQHKGLGRIRREDKDVLVRVWMQGITVVEVDEDADD